MFGTRSTITRFLPVVCRSFTSLNTSVVVSTHRINQKTCVPNPNLPQIDVYRYYSSKKNAKAKHKPTVKIDERLMGQVVDVENIKKNMEKAVENLQKDFVAHLSLRSTTGSVEQLPIHLDGKEHTLQELAQIVRKNPKTLVINMSTFPQAIPAALKAIEKSGMNLNVQQDGTTLFVPIPKVTKEYRESLAKAAKQLFVKCKDAIRDVQIKQVKQIKKKEGVSEDLVRTVENQIIALADTYIEKAETILKTKQNELLGKDE
ncbi:unnamed protein product [Acanthoscelides obtectus]|uniref:Ribosome-recycling factor, mitochondrial n=1 Tax=Acanthoscelides obtectus TaxID=200917 RepID=A0A9P0KPL3_ACAOB|nr:unnamed protein product [Acanthoscelides obtectus]CAK1678331.1 Ribosome-recycling factor, mitochondrial [Acanthoscelides obtectus]